MSNSVKIMDGGWSLLVDDTEKPIGNKEEARELLNSYRDTEDGINYYIKVGPSINENDDSYIFACWPYSDAGPLDKSFAFIYWVQKNNGEIGSADAPIDKAEAKRLYKKYFEPAAKTRTFNQAIQPPQI